MAEKKRPVKKAAARKKPAKKATRTVKPAKHKAGSKPKVKVKARAKPKARAAAKQKPQKKSAKAPTRRKNFSLESKVRRHKDVAWRIIDGEAVIVTPSDSVMHTLNDVGTRIWELLTGERNLNQVARLLCADFEVDLGRSQQDTLWFAQCLQKKGLVEAAG